MKTIIVTIIVAIGAVSIYSAVLPRQYENQKLSIQSKVNDLEHQALMSNWRTHFEEVLHRLHERMDSLRSRKVEVLVAARKLKRRIEDLDQKVIMAQSNSALRAQYEKNRATCEEHLSKYKVLVEKINLAGENLQQTIDQLSNKYVSLEGKEQYAESLMLLQAMSKKWIGDSGPLKEDMVMIQEIEDSIEKIVIEAEIREEVDVSTFKESDLWNP